MASGCGGSHLARFALYWCRSSPFVRLLPSVGCALPLNGWCISTIDSQARLPARLCPIQVNNHMRTVRLALPYLRHCGIQMTWTIVSVVVHIRFTTCRCLRL